MSALLVILVVLPVIGIALNNAFERQVKANVKDELKAHFYSVLALTEFENESLLMPDALLENQFNVINSGLYALISSKTNSDIENIEILWFSNSFLAFSEDSEINSTLAQPKLGEENFNQLSLNQESHFIYSFSVRFDTSSINDTAANLSPIFTLHIIKDLSKVEQQISNFGRLLWAWIIVLMFILLLIQGCWLLWTLKPLARFTNELNRVQNGKQKQLSEQYPLELGAVAKQLNTLLNNEQRQRQRYRNALADLAHSLKTPLAVIQSQQELNDSSKEQIIRMDKVITHQLKRAQSAGGQAWHLGIDLKQTIQKLLPALGKIYPHIAFHCQFDEQSNLVFQGDESDVTEMLGNLLDNASKAAKKRVLLRVESNHKAISFIVEDDGKGIEDSAKSTILQRGKRADTYAKGNGIGLAIVQDLVTTYQGTLLISRSKKLGGAQFTITLPKV